MEDENDLDNIFEEYENADVPESTNVPQNEENSANTETNEAQTREVVPVPKRIIRNPRLKFNADRLCGERGIPIVTKHFQNVKFKGKGHEKEDLNKLLSTLEHWSHRLFPSMKFEACLRQIEKLGKKRAVQTCLVKIRRDMPILNSDFVHDNEDDEREGAQNELDFEPPPQDAFDRLFGESLKTAQPSNLTSTLLTPSSSGTALGSSFGGSLTEEQRKRMEYNKMLATERRKAMMAAKQVATEDEDSGRVSPSVLEPGFVENNVSRTTFESSLNLDQQFDSLFDQSNRETLVHGDSEKNEDESMYDDSQNNRSAYDDSEKNRSTYEDSEKNLQESEKNLHQSTSDDSEKNPHDFEKSHHESILEDDSKKNERAPIQEDSERNQYESTHDSVTIPHESTHDVSKLNERESMHLTIEKETEELGLDELMDLVDAEDTTST